MCVGPPSVLLHGPPLLLQGSGLTALEEAVLAQAELCNLQASQQGSVKGVVIETRMDKGLG